MRGGRLRTPTLPLPPVLLLAVVPVPGERHEAPAPVRGHDAAGRRLRIEQARAADAHRALEPRHQRELGVVPARGHDRQRHNGGAGLRLDAGAHGALVAHSDEGAVVAREGELLGQLRLEPLPHRAGAAAPRLRHLRPAVSLRRQRSRRAGLAASGAVRRWRAPVSRSRQRSVGQP